MKIAIIGAGNVGSTLVVDATNPLKPDLSGLALGHTTSAGEEVARWAAGAKVVKAEALGFEPVDAGPLSQARLLEPLAMLWISMALLYGQGPNIAFKLLER